MTAYQTIALKRSLLFITVALFGSMAACQSKVSSGTPPSTLNIPAGVVPPATTGVTNAALTVPTNVTATAASPTLVNVAWQDTAGDEVGFVVYRATGTGTFSQIKYISGAVFAYPDSTVVGSTTYNYEVFAVDSSSNLSNVSNISSVTTPAAATGGGPTGGGTTPTVPPAPTALAANLTNPTTATLSWSQSSSVTVTGYNIERSVNGGAFAYAGYSANATSFTDTVQPGTNYVYEVYAFNGVGNSPFSNTAALNIPNAPTCVISTNNTTPIYGFQSSIITMTTAGNPTSATFMGGGISVNGGSGPYLPQFVGQTYNWVGTVTNSGCTNNCSPVTTVAQGGFSAVDYFWISNTGPGRARPNPYPSCPNGLTRVGSIADGTGGGVPNGNIEFCQGLDYLSSDADTTPVFTYFAVTPEGSPFTNGADGLLGTIFGNVADCLNGVCNGNQWFHFANQAWNTIPIGGGFIVNIWMMDEGDNTRGNGGPSYCPAGYVYITDFANGTYGRLQGNQTMCALVAQKPNSFRSQNFDRVLLATFRV